MRMAFDSSKSGVYIFGYIKNEASYFKDLKNLVGHSIDVSDLETNLARSYENQEELNYYYDDNGDLSQGDFDENKTFLYALYTGFNELNQKKIYATFTKDAYGAWSGVRFFTESRMKNFFNAYRMGKISFKNYKSANDFITQIEENLLPGERWQFKESTISGYRPKTKFDILQSYLHYTFEKLLIDHCDKGSRNYEKIIFSNDKKYAIFNTGLLNKYAQDVYILGEVFNSNSGTFTLSNPMISPGIIDLIKTYNFDSRMKFPDVVEFFDAIDDIVFDSNFIIDLEDTEKLKHIIEDGINRKRFPEKYQELYDKGDLASITTTLRTAIENAKKIAKRNYKYVVPQYRSAQNGEPGKIQFLMPIYLENQYGEKPDFALVLNKEKFPEQSYYMPETVLELPWAYNNARVICKPEDTWLNPTSISSPLLVEDDE